MSEHDFDLAVLRAVRDIGVTPPDAQRLRAAVAAALARETQAAPRRWRVWPLRRIAGARVLVPAAGVIVAVAVAGLALVGLGSRTGTSVSASPSRGLLDRLSVLRRPQTPADRLPPRLHLISAGGNGQIIPSLTRLVATPPGARMYLVVTRPGSGDGQPIWSPRLGDLVSILTVTAAGGEETPGQPAVDLSDGFEVQVVFNSLDRRPRVAWPARLGAFVPRPRVLYRIAIVPDGVARVAWRYRVMHLVRGFAEPTGRTVIVHPTVVGNVAYAPGSQQPEQLGGVDWHAADGTAIPTSAAALRQAVIHRQTVIRLQALHEVAGNTYRADPMLLRAFAVFAVTSRNGVVLGDGVTVSDPPVESLPFAILNLLEPNDAVTEPDVHAVRQVTMPSGVEFYVIAGARGLCAATIDRGIDPSGNPALAGLGGGGGESCARGTANALQRGTGGTDSNAAGSTTVWVRPNAHPYVTIPRGSSKRTFAPADGVYATRAPIAGR